MSLDRNFKEDGHSLEITYYWKEPGHKPGYIFFTIWEILSLLFFHHEIIRLVTGEMPTGQSFFATLLCIALFFVPFYWMLLIWVNKTIIHMTPEHVSVRHGPLPSRSTNYIFSLKDLNNIWVEKAKEDSEEDNGMNVLAILKSGEEVILIKNMPNPEESETIRRRALKWLRETVGFASSANKNFPDRPAPGPGNMPVQ